MPYNLCFYFAANIKVVGISFPFKKLKKLIQK